MRFSRGWTRVINIKIFEELRLPCAFAFRKQTFFKEVGQPYFSCIGYCRYKPCSQDIYGECKEKVGDDNIEIVSKCLNTRGINHHGTSIYLTDADRLKVGNVVVGTNPLILRIRQAKEYLDESGSNCCLVNNTMVLQKLKQETKDKILGVKKYPGKPLEAILKIADDYPEVPEVSPIPFYIYFWSENQLKLWNEAAELGQYISIDATGSLVKSPNIFEDAKSSANFLYVIVTNIDKKICPVCQNSSSCHDTESTHSWVSMWI